MKYYIGQRLRMKALEQDQGDDLPNEFFVTSVTYDGWIGVIQRRSAPGTQPTFRKAADLDELFETLD